MQVGTMQMNIDATSAAVAFGSVDEYSNFGVNGGTLTLDSVGSTISGSFDLVASSFDDQFATFTAIGTFQDIELPTE